MANRFLRLANSLVSAVVLLALLLTGAYALFALWDNHRVYAAARDVQADLLQLRPGLDDLSAGFESLREVNPDVRAWLVVDNTHIDCPVVQGADNMAYVNQDVYGEFSLAGSIFLDSGCDGGFQDPYSLLYGHHMEKHQMFGDLDLFKDETFFRRNRSGMLLLPDRAYELEVFACLTVTASDEFLFRPERWTEDALDPLLDYVKEHALYVREAALEAVRDRQGAQVLALSTCASDFTDARTVVLAWMTPTVREDLTT